jgi:hypothetical protein
MLVALFKSFYEAKLRLFFETTIEREKVRKRESKKGKKLREKLERKKGKRKN